MRKIKIIIWKARDGWRWHMKRCGRIIAESGESYGRRRSIYRVLEHLVESFKDNKYEIVHQ